MARPPKSPSAADVQKLAAALGIGPRRYQAQPAAGNVFSKIWRAVFGSSASVPQSRRRALEEFRGLAEETPEQHTAGQRGGSGGGRIGSTSPAPAISPPGGRRTPPPPPAPPPQGPGPRPYQPARELGDVDEAYFSDEFMVPTSSNVYSFQYFRRPHDKTGILYVTYKASGINPDSVSHGRKRKGRSTSRRQLIGTLGSTVTGNRRNEAGPLYAYYDVPPGVFTRMKLARSKGKFVWDTLRIRGSIYGHKYKYALVQGQVSPNVGGVYIPRKATSKGFRSRSISDMGTGRRGFQTSTLPTSSGGRGFTSRPAPRPRGRS